MMKLTGLTALAILGASLSSIADEQGGNCPVTVGQKALIQYPNHVFRALEKIKVEKDEFESTAEFEERN